MDSNFVNQYRLRLNESRGLPKETPLADEDLQKLQAAIDRPREPISKLKLLVAAVMVLVVVVALFGTVLGLPAIAAYWATKVVWVMALCLASAWAGSGFSEVSERFAKTLAKHLKDPTN